MKWVTSYWGKTTTVCATEKQAVGGGKECEDYRSAMGGGESRDGNRKLDKKVEPARYEWPGKSKKHIGGKKNKDQ